MSVRAELLAAELTGTKQKKRGRNLVFVDRTKAQSPLSKHLTQAFRPVCTGDYST